MTRAAWRLAVLALLAVLAVLAGGCDPAIEKGGDLAFVLPLSMVSRPLGPAKALSGPIAPADCVGLCGYDTTDTAAVVAEYDLSCSYGELVGSSGVATDVVVCRGRFESSVVDRSTWSPITLPDDPNHTQ